MCLLSRTGRRFSRGAYPVHAFGFQAGVGGHQQVLRVVVFAEVHQDGGRLKHPHRRVIRSTFTAEIQHAYVG